MTTIMFAIIALALLLVFGSLATLLIARRRNTPAGTGASPISGVDLAAQQHAEIQALLGQGNKIAAIRRVRELRGVGLKEAKDYVDRLALPVTATVSALPAAAAPPAASGDFAEVHQLARQGNKIAAIKRYRELTGVGLKQAKDYVDRL